MSTHQTALLVSVLMLVGAVAAVPATGLAATSATADRPTSVASMHAENASNANATVTPGQQLSGILGVQEAELDGTIESRTFGIKIARAASNNSKAGVVKEQLTSIENRLMSLEAQRDALKEAHENGNISAGQYQARLAVLAAQTESVKNLTTQSEDSANDLPRDVLEQNDINVTAIQTLKQNAENLTGPEVAEIARSIAGPNAGKPVPRGPPADPGPPDNAGPPTTNSASSNDQNGPSDNPGPPEDPGPPENARNGNDR